METIKIQTEEEAIQIVNDLRLQTSLPGFALLIDTSIPIHTLPLRSLDDYLSEITWRQSLIDSAVKFNSLTGTLVE